jgi:hypothetical protein
VMRCMAAFYSSDDDRLDWLHGVRPPLPQRAPPPGRSLVSYP